METFFHYNRYLHIAAGSLGFFLAPLALAVRKGGIAHRRWGKAFFWAMLMAGITSLIGAKHISSAFLFFTGIFSLYLAAFGYRSVYLRHLSRPGAAAAAADWVAAIAALAVFGGTVVYGLVSGNVVSMVFGIIGSFIAVRQLLGFRRAGAWSKQQWLLNHISGFMGAYIAAVSAFSATSLKFIPFPYNFLWPTAVGVPFIIWWHRRVRGNKVTASNAGEVRN